MHKLLLITVLLIGFNCGAQSFGIPIKDHAYYNIIEWKGKGGLLMSRSPKEILNQINLTLVGEKEEGMWDQKFNPKVRDPHYIFNEGPRYVYFLDNLDLVSNGRATFNQMNAAGNVKSKVLDIGIKVKRLSNDVDYNKFEFIDAAVTEKALVYHYRYYHKKEKEYREFAVFMTHHNLIHLVFELGRVDSKSVDSGENGQWKFAGFKEGIIYFALREIKADVPGFTVKGFSTKGLIVEDHLLFEPENLRLFRNIGYGNTGKYYVKDEDRHAMEKGLVSYIDGHFYLAAIQKRNGGSELILLKQDGEEWEELNSVRLSTIDEEQEIQLGTFPINEGITYHYKHKEEDKVGILLFEKGVKGEQEDFTERSAYNPSRLLINNEDNQFVCTVPTGKILECDLSQFTRAAGISFIHRK